mgnify:CR=1 FL=1
MANPAESTKIVYKVKEPESPELNISSKKEPKSYKLACKYALRKFGCVELRSLGNASESVVALAESLVRNKFAVIDKIESGLTDLADANNETGARKGIQFIVKLKKSPEFDELAKNLPPPETA